MIADTGRGTLRPGGIFNDGFALSWASERHHDAQAAPASGQGWAGNRIRDRRHGRARRTRRCAVRRPTCCR